MSRFFIGCFIDASSTRSIAQHTSLRKTHYAAGLAKLEALAARRARLTRKLLENISLVRVAPGSPVVPIRQNPKQRRSACVRPQR